MKEYAGVENLNDFVGRQFNQNGETRDWILGRANANESYKTLIQVSTVTFNNGKPVYANDTKFVLKIKE